MFFFTGCYVRHGRFVSKRLFTSPKAQRTDVNDRKHADCSDPPKHDFHCTLHHRGFLCQRAISGLVALVIAPNRSPPTNQLTAQNRHTRLNGKAGHATGGERVEGVFANCRSSAACRSRQPARPIQLIARNLLPSSRSEAVSSRRIHNGLWPEKGSRFQI